MFKDGGLYGVRYRSVFLCQMDMRKTQDRGKMFLKAAD